MLLSGMPPQKRIASAPRCPLASRGLDSTLLRACPGFRQETVGFAGMGHGEAIAGTSCAHLRPWRSARGFLPACAHPRSDAVTRAARLVDSVPQARWSEMAQLPLSVIVTDADGVVTHWNARAEELFGWSCDQAVGRPIMETTVGDAALGTAAEVMTAVLNGRAWEGVFDARHRDGVDVPIRVLDVPMFARDARLAGVVGFSVPADDRRTDLRLQATQARLLDAGAVPLRV
jgi:PAS domain S-box-containing protein